MEDVINDIKELLEIAKTDHVKRLLNNELIRLGEKQATASDSNTTPVQKGSVKASTIVKTVDRYGWDQSDKYVKLYVTLHGINEFPKEQIKVKFTSNSVGLLVTNLNNKNYTLNIKALCNTIVPESSSYKLKNDDIIITMKKATSEHWSHLTKAEVKEIPKPSMAPDADPSQGIMNLMKKMYEEGDDEMKRTIAKAWTESREKNMQGGYP